MNSGGGSDCVGFLLERYAARVGRNVLASFWAQSLFAIRTKTMTATSNLKNVASQNK